MSQTPSDALPESSKPRTITLKAGEVIWNVRLKEDLDVVIKEDGEDGLLSAEAPTLGLLIPGIGNTVDEAIEYLFEQASLERDTLVEEGKKVVHYAAEVRDQLVKHLEPLELQ